jgi:hypothetical protein
MFINKINCFYICIELAVLSTTEIQYFCLALCPIRRCNSLTYWQLSYVIICINTFNHNQYTLCKQFYSLAYCFNPRLGLSWLKVMIDIITVTQMGMLHIQFSHVSNKLIMSKSCSLYLKFKSPQLLWVDTKQESVLNISKL